MDTNAYTDTQLFISYTCDEVGKLIFRRRWAGAPRILNHRFTSPAMIIHSIAVNSDDVITRCDGRDVTRFGVFRCTTHHTAIRTVTRKQLIHDA